MKLCLACDHAFESDRWICPACAWQPSAKGGILCLAPELVPGSEGFDPKFFDHLFQLEEGSFWFHARNRLLVWALDKYFPTARQMLEVGCGTGFVLTGLSRARPDLRLTGTELYHQGLALAATRVSGATFLQMDARRIPYIAEFDLIGAFDMLEHIEEDETVIGQMSRALQPGGGLLLTVPQHPGLWSASDDYAHHKRRYVRPELVTKLQRWGFDVIRHSSFVSLLMPLLVLSRARHRSTGEFDPESEYRMPRFVGHLLGATMTLERWLIMAGVSFPFGGSLLLVARKRGS